MQPGMHDNAAMGSAGDTAPAPATLRTSTPAAAPDHKAAYPRNHAVTAKQKPAGNTPVRLAGQIAPKPLLRPHLGASQTPGDSVSDAAGLPPVTSEAMTPMTPRQIHDQTNPGRNPGQGQELDSGPTHDAVPTLRVSANASERRESPRGLQAQATLDGNVQPLLAAIPQVHKPATAAALAANPGQPAARMVEETTEVHVSIGRIEVMAFQQAPAPKKAPRNTRAPLSLDDYLARRRGQTP